MIQDQTAPLRRVYVREPRRDDLAGWRSYGWLAAPDPSRAEQEHAAFRAELERAGAEVVEGKAEVPGDPDAIYTYDPALLTDDGAVLLRPGKPGRRSEPAAARADLAEVGVEILAELVEPATAEGGDLFWLDPSTLLAGRGYRTNDEGIAQLRTHLGARGVDVRSYRGDEISRKGGGGPTCLTRPLARG